MAENTFRFHLRVEVTQSQWMLAAANSVSRNKTSTGSTAERYRKYLEEVRENRDWRLKNIEADEEASKVLSQEEREIILEERLAKRRLEIEQENLDAMSELLQSEEIKNGRTAAVKNLREKLTEREQELDKKEKKAFREREAKKKAKKTEGNAKSLWDSLTEAKMVQDDDDPDGIEGKLYSSLEIILTEGFGKIFSENSPFSIRNGIVKDECIILSERLYLGKIFSKRRYRIFGNGFSISITNNALNWFLNNFFNQKELLLEISNKKIICRQLPQLTEFELINEMEAAIMRNIVAINEIL